MTFMPSIAGAPPTGSAGGDLAGTYPNPTVTTTHLSAALPYAQGGNGATTQAGLVANTTLFSDEPTGTWARTFPRGLVSTNNQAAFATTGVVAVRSIPLPAGGVVNNIFVMYGTTAANGPTHQWAALTDANLNVLAVSADGTNAAIAASTLIKYAMGTPFTIATAGQYFVAVSVTATTTAPTACGGGLATNLSGTLTSQAPAFCGTAGTQTTPPALAAQLNSGTVSANGAMNIALWIS